VIVKGDNMPKKGSMMVLKRGSSVWNGRMVDQTTT